MNLTSYLLCFLEKQDELLYPGLDAAHVVGALKRHKHHYITLHYIIGISNATYT